MWNDFEQKTAINKRVQKRYDELLEAGKHGLYETLFRVVHEERALAKLELEAHIIRWLEANQPDVFKIGLWDAIYAARAEMRK